MHGICNLIHIDSNIFKVTFKFVEVVLNITLLVIHNMINLTDLVNDP